MGILIKGQVYRNSDGAQYIYQGLALMEDTKEICAVIEGRGSKTLWIIPIEKFKERYTHVTTPSAACR